MDNDGGGCRRFILVDDEYKLFFDHHLNGDNSFLPPFDDDNGESETRKFSGDSRRTKLCGGGTEKKPINNNRVSQQRKRETIGSEAEVSRENIQRDNRVAERRKRKMAEFDLEVSRNQVNIQPDKIAREVSESTKVDTLRDVPLFRAKEVIQRDGKARKVSESTKVNTSRNVTDNVGNADSVMDNDGGGCKRFILVDDEYKLVLDCLSDDNSFLPPFEDENREFETRSVNMFSVDSKRSKLGGTEKKPKRKTIGSEAEVSRASPLVTTRESIQRDNRVAERRKRKLAELESARVSRAVPLANIHGDNKARKVSESKVNTSRDVPLVRVKEVIKRGNEARKLPESTKVNTSRDFPLVRNPQVIQRDSNARKISASKVDTLRDVPLVRSHETIQRENIVKKMSESNVNTSRDVPLFRTKEVVGRDNRFAERRKKKIDETEATGTSNKTPRFVPVTQSNKGVSVGTRKNNVSVVDKDYRSYLTWLVDSLQDSTTVPGPTPETQKQSSMAPEKDLRAKVMVELDTESCSDDDDMIMVSDSPFLCGGSTPFVVSKSKTVIDLEKDSSEDESTSCMFTKELMDVLEKPYDKKELLRLSREVSEKKPVSRCRELRKGRESNYETAELGPSYLEKVSDFDKEYRRVDGEDKARLKLLRGFFFYLKNVTRAGSFKPWLPENQKKLGLKKQCLQP